MARRKSSSPDATGIKDSIKVALTNADGAKGPDPDEWGEEQTRAADEQDVGEDVKGPDPEVWGDRDAEGANR